MALEWLSARDREWVAQHHHLLNAVWTRFELDGEWPNPVEVLRELRAADPNRRVNAALDEMPVALCRRDYAPPRLILTIFGLGCCPGANRLLRQYLEVAQLALQRFDLPHLPNRLRRADAVEALGLTKTEADRLSAVLMLDAPFLGSGTSGIDDWEREIDPRAEEFQGIDGTEALLTYLSTQRRIAVEPEAQPPPPPGPVQPEVVPVHDGPEDLPSKLTAPAALATIGGFVITLFQSPSAWSWAVVGGLLGLTASLWRLSWRRFLPAAVVLGAGAGALIGVSLSAEGDSGPYRYFVSSTGDAAVVIGLIEPRQQAAMQRDTVLGLGDSVSVKCMTNENNQEWAKLPNGSFVPAARLTVEVGGEAATSC